MDLRDGDQSTLRQSHGVEKAPAVFRNVPDVALTTSDSLNTYDVLRPDKLLFTRSAFEKVEARLANA
jgi:ribosomal protein L4